MDAAVPGDFLPICRRVLAVPELPVSRQEVNERPRCARNPPVQPLRAFYLAVPRR
jgi:hypothetical protein